MPANHGVRSNHDERAAPLWPEAGERHPERPIERRETGPRALVDVDGELLAERQLHEGLVLAASKERERTSKRAGEKREPRAEHRRILAAAGME